MGILTARLVPVSAFVAAFRLARWLLPRKRRLAQRHVARLSQGELRGHRASLAVARVFGNYGRYCYELFRLHLEPSQQRLVDFSSQGLEHLQAAKARGKGVILAAPHLGNWDRAGAWLAEFDEPLVVVAEPTKSPRLTNWFVRQRQRLGMHVILLGENSTRRILQELGYGQVVCLVCDRNIAGEGVTVKFFYEQTVMPGGPALLALRSGAALVPVATYFTPAGKQHMRFLPSIKTERQGKLADDVARITQELASQFEMLMRGAPDQWLVLQPNWPSDFTDAS